ncbi:unnamed protein product [Adineta ricciae]|uniref:Aftiphilin-like protein n=2 Tax=Adineta ricciae TaxID=249248 RepID=A0A813U252_ADIRI|nr:unnamed protein product [Adineta ricciae]
MFTDVMSQSVVIPPVHDTSPPPFDDDVDENDTTTTIKSNEIISPILPDVVEDSNEEWKSVDDNNDTDIAQIQDDVPSTEIEKNSMNGENPHEENNTDDNWANFAAFETKAEDTVEAAPATTSNATTENDENGWASFESTTVPSSEQVVQSSSDEQTTKPIEDEDDDDFGEFSEVQVAPKPQASSLPTNTLSSEQIDSLISTCFPLEPPSPSIANENYAVPSTDLPSFTSCRNPAKQLAYLQSSLSLWNVLSNLSNDPVGIQFQWRKSNTERLFHQALGVNERFRAKNVPLTPEILQPEKVKSIVSVSNDSEDTENGNKLATESIRPHFDWKQSGLQNPLTVFDANKTLDLDFYVPTMKSPTEEEHITSPSSSQATDSPIIPQAKSAIPIKTVDLFPGSTTIISDDAKRIMDTLPNLSFMSAKALMFPVRFNANNNDELY